MAELFNELCHCCLKEDPYQRPDSATVYKYLSVLWNRCQISDDLAMVIPSIETGIERAPPNIDKFDKLWKPTEVRFLSNQLASNIVVDVETIANRLKTKQNLKRIGKGMFGEVYQVDNVAVKLVTAEEEIEKQKDELNRELEMFLTIAEQSSAHAHIVSFLGYGFAERQQWFFVLECALGSLKDALSKALYDTSYRLQWCKHIADALRFLHSFPQPMIHRDLKPGNILLFDNYRVAKIADFGLARLLADRMTEGAGTIAYGAPEVLTSDTYDVRCDVYSFGALCWAIFNRKEFKKASLHQDESHLRIRNCYQQCLKSKLEERPKIGDVLDAIENIIIHALTPDNLADIRKDEDAYMKLWDQWKNTTWNTNANQRTTEQTILVVGGDKDESQVSTISIKNLTNGQSWAVAAFPVSSFRFRAAAAVFVEPKQLLLIGGIKEERAEYSAYLTTADQFDLLDDFNNIRSTSPFSGASTSVSDAPQKSRQFCEAASLDYNTKAIIVGGGGRSAELFRHSRDVSDCIYLPDMNESRDKSAVAAMASNRPLVTGGRSSSQTAEYLDVPEMRWLNEQQRINGERYNHAAASMDGRIFVAGGMKDITVEVEQTARNSTRERKTVDLKSVECTDNREQRQYWHKMPDMIHSRSSHRLLALDQWRLAAIGGSNFDEKTLNSVEIFDVRNLSWHEASPLPKRYEQFYAALM